MNLHPIAHKAIEAYGGITLWQNYQHIEAEVSAHGLAFTLKRRPFFEHAKIEMDIARPFSKITPIDKHKQLTGVLDGNDVRLEDLQGNVIKERKNARAKFPYGRRLFYWDDLDMAYFANYAFWNYFTLPRLLINEDIIWKQKSEGVLQATFPDHLPTHNKVQEFRFNQTTGLLEQHNYTAAVISGLAKAANVVLKHQQAEGIVYPSSRLVTPRGSQGKALSGPSLINIRVHKFKIKL